MIPPSVSVSIGKVEVQLLDPTTGRLIKSWVFTEHPQISIGRLPEMDIEINDPYVSRTHATLTYQNSRWYIVSHGKHGVLIDHRQIHEQVLEHETVFRLGPEGPSFRFRLATEPAGNSNTITFDALPTLQFKLDKNKLQNEVERITSEDYFQSLQERAKAIRARQQDT